MPAPETPKTKHKLAHPIQGLLGVLTEVEVRTLVLVGDVLAVNKLSPDPVMQGALMIGRLTGLDISEVELLSVDDFEAIDRIAGKKALKP